jgi:hypothetical protein
LRFDRRPLFRTNTIEVKGDTRREADEFFTLELFGANSSVWLWDSIGLGMIMNDD